MKFTSKLSCKWHWLWLSILIIILDLFSKYLAVRFLSLGDAVNLFPGFNFTLAYNKGAAFSFLANQGGWQRWFFIILAGVMSLVILLWMKFMSPSRVWGLSGLALILGGAIGNGVNRFYSGHVIDFIDLYVSKYHWPVFNIADSAICIGVLFLIINEGCRGR